MGSFKRLLGLFVEAKEFPLVIGDPTTVREGKDVLHRMDTSVDIMVADNDRQSSSIQQAVRTQNIPDEKKVSLLSVGRNVTGKDDMAHLVLEYIFQHPPGVPDVDGFELRAEMEIGNMRYAKTDPSVYRCSKKPPDSQQCTRGAPLGLT